MAEIEAPAFRLASRVLAGDAVEPALDAAGQGEVAGVDGQDEPAVEDALVEPVGKHELHPLDAARVGDEFLPLVDPGELLPSPVFAFGSWCGSRSTAGA